MKTTRMAWAAVAAWIVCSAGVATAQFTGSSLFGPPAGESLGDGTYIVPVAASMALADDAASPTAPEGMAVTPNGNYSGQCGPGACNACGQCADCCRCPHKYGAFGELLYLRSRGGEVPYAVGANGPVAPAAGNLPIYTPVTRYARVDPNERAGFRFGVTYYLDDCASTITASYTRFESMDADTLNVQPGTVIAPLTLIPTVLNVGAFGLAATASESIDFQFFDVDYKSPFFWNDCVKLSYLAGGRYGQLDQEFIANYTLNPGAATVLSNVNFTGGGIKLGLEGIAETGRRGIFGYAKGNGSMLGGTFRADYLHNDVFGGTIANTSYRAARMVTVAETELGLGWHSKNNNLRLSVGYMFNSWYNVMKVNEYINSVRTSNMTDPSDNFNGVLSFDGLVARVEGQW